MSLIVQCVNNRQLEILMEKESSYTNENLKDHIKTFEEILRQVRETGAVVSEDDIVCALLNSLPDSFSIIVTVLENLPEESLNVDVVKEELRDKVDRRRLQPNSDKSGDKTSVAFTAKQKFNEKSTIQNHYHNNQQYSRVENQNYLGIFMNYRRPNRFASQPRHPGNRRNQNQMYKHSNYMEAANKDIICIVSESKRDFEEDREEHDLKFFVDSGCTDHLVKDDIAKNGGFINATGVGNIKAVSYFAKKKTKCEIKNVLHVPELRRNLLSVKKLEMNRMTVKFENGEVKLLNKIGDCFGSGKRDKLYEIEFKVEKFGCYETEIKNEELTTWHQRLGHIGYTTLEKLIKRKVVEEPDDSEISKFQQEVEEDKLEGVSDGYKQGYNSKTNRQLPIRFNDYELYLAYEAFTDGNQDLEAYADSVWANEEDRKSISGYMYKWKGKQFYGQRRSNIV
ncbi:hypothetical protein ILUMI_08742 [Ignelater luminosus]|uniref:Retrovirus-related Pol polyprotein from transposon TNT 1-94-like beta-barrel domain-containing protein n=1 Tax=Ignelater luminosus TaxID=2038154 RepID=A0A8K0GGR0_IGNLU|nr:hypothetical protein ILUMI_08742 [Ignelater luminosus]